MNTIFLFLSIVFSLPPSHAVDFWGACEQSIHRVHSDVVRIVTEVDRAEPANLDRINIRIVLAPGMTCPSNQKYEDMPRSLRESMEDYVEGLGTGSLSFAGSTAEQGLESYRRFSEEAVRDKVSKTVRSKVAGAFEMTRQEKEEVKKELARRRKKQ